MTMWTFNSRIAEHVQVLTIRWQWRNFFRPIHASCSGRHDVGARRPGDV